MLTSLLSPGSWQEWYYRQYKPSDSCCADSKGLIWSTFVTTPKLIDFASCCQLVLLWAQGLIPVDATFRSDTQCIACTYLYQLGIKSSKLLFLCLRAGTQHIRANYVYLFLSNMVNMQIELCSTVQYRLSYQHCIFYSPLSWIQSCYLN